MGRGCPHPEMSFRVGEIIMTNGSFRRVLAECPWNETPETHPLQAEYSGGVHYPEPPPFDVKPDQFR